MIHTHIKPISLEEVLPHRQKVMYPNLTIEEMRLEKDHEGEHLGLFVENTLTSIVSLFSKSNEIHFRKLATLPNAQNKGFASQLLNHVFEIASERGIKRIWCNSRISACQLYEKFGMIKTNHTFTKHGIDFVIMERILGD